MDTALECMNGPDDCEGTVEYRSVDGRGSAPPRCDFHFERRLQQRENSSEMYAYSDVPPPGFDPSYAGERFHEDDY